MQILGDLHGEVLVPQPVTVTEIGMGGVQIETAFPFQLESLHELRLVLGKHSLVVKGRVTHCGVVDVEQEGVRYRSGVQFVDIPDHVRSAVQAFVETAKAGRRPAT